MNVVVLVTVYNPYCVLVAPDVHVTLIVSINVAVKVAVPPVYVNDFGLIETDNSVLAVVRYTHCAGKVYTFYRIVPLIKDKENLKFTAPITPSLEYHMYGWEPENTKE